MVVSFDTMLKIYECMLRHLSDKQIDRIIQDLKQIPGNKSFRETVERLEMHHNTHRNRGYGMGR